MTTSASGLLLPSLDHLIADAARSSGVTAVLDAADRLHGQIAAEHRATPASAPLPFFYSQCSCGSVMEISGDGPLTEEDHDAIRDWWDAHDSCETESGDRR